MKTTTLLQACCFTAMACSSLAVADTVHQGLPLSNLMIINGDIPVEEMVNYQGIIKADSMESHNGKIVLLAHNTQPTMIAKKTSQNRHNLN